MYRNIYYIIGLLLLACCSNDEEYAPGNDGRQRVNISVFAENGAISNDVKAGLYMVNYVDDIKDNLLPVGNYINNQLIVYRNNSWQSEQPIYWYDENTPADFYVYAPYRKDVENACALPSGVVTDQTTNAGMAQSDFLYGTIMREFPSESNFELKMQHHFSKMTVVITTDGMENASREYTYERLKAKIEHQKEKYGWEFLFLGANIDAVSTAKKFGVDEDHAVDYHCDREGLLVWQDMPNGDTDRGVEKWVPKVFNGGADMIRKAESKTIFYQEWKEIMDLCMSNPSVVVWVPFNEAWGQFDTEEVTEWTKNYDPSRLVNSASGGNHRPCGDIMDLHNYPAPDMFLYDPQRVNVLGEYGGIGLPIENHLWWNKRNWGYIQFKNSDEVTAEYIKYAEILKDFIKRGFSAAVYTQTTDVEGEVNGLMTYDRKVIKINEPAVKEVNMSVINVLK